MDQKDLTTETQDELNAIEALAKIKETHVPKAELDKAKEINQALLKKVIDGEKQEQPKETKPDFKELIGKSRNFNGNQTTNLELITHNLEIKKHYPDRIKFAGNPRDEKIAIDFWTQLVQDSNGDAALFNKLLKDRVPYDASLDNENGKLTGNQ